MNEALLREIHTNLGISHNFQTWVRYAKTNPTYLKQLHLNYNGQASQDTGYVFKFGDFNEWKKNVWGMEIDTDAASNSDEIFASVFSESGSYKTTVNSDLYESNIKMGRDAREDVIKQWKEDYGGYGFEFDTMQSGIKIIAPNGREMKIPYLKHQDRDVKVGALARTRQLFHYGSVNLKSDKALDKIENDVKRFINENQSPEHMKMKSKNKKDLFNVLKDGLDNKLTELANRDYNIAYAGESSTQKPISNLMDSKYWNREVKQEIYDWAQEEFAEKHGTGSGLSKYDQEAVIEKYLTYVRNQETINSNIAARDWQIKNGPEKSTMYISEMRDMLISELSPEDKIIGNVVKQLHEKRKLLDKLEIERAQKGFLSPADQQRFLNTEKEIERLQAKNKELVEKRDAKYGNEILFDFHQRKRISREDLADNQIYGMSAEEIEKALEQLKKTGSYTGVDVNGNTFNIGEITKSVEAYKTHLANMRDQKEIEFFLDNFDNFLVRYGLHKDAINNSTFDIVKPTQDPYSGNYISISRILKNDKNFNFKEETIIKKTTWGEMNDDQDSNIFLPDGQKSTYWGMNLTRAVDGVWETMSADERKKWPVYKLKKGYINDTLPDDIKDKIDNHEFTFETVGFKNVPFNVLEKHIPTVTNWTGAGTRFGEIVDEVDGASVMGFSGEIPLDLLPNYLRALQIQKFDLEAEKLGWIDMAVLNIDPGSIERKNSARQGTYEGFSKKETLHEKGNKNYNDNKIASAQRIINDINVMAWGLGEDVGFRTTEAQEENFRKNFWEEFGYGAGGMVPIVAEFAAVTIASRGLATPQFIALKMAERVTRYGRRVVQAKNAWYTRTILTADEIATKVLSSKKWAPKIARGDISKKKAIKEFIKQHNLEKVSKSGKFGRSGLWERTADNAQFIALHAAKEEAKVQLVNKIFDEEMPVGMGASFWWGGRFANKVMKSWKLGGKFAVFNPVIEKHMLGGVGFAFASEVALPVEGLINSIIGNESWQRFYEHNYKDLGLSGIFHRTAQNVLLGNALGIQSYGKGMGKLTKLQFLESGKLGISPFQAIKGKGGLFATMQGRINLQATLTSKNKQWSNEKIEALGGKIEKLKVKDPKTNKHVEYEVVNWGKTSKSGIGKKILKLENQLHNARKNGDAKKAGKLQDKIDVEMSKLDVETVSKLDHLNKKTRLSTELLNETARSIRAIDSDLEYLSPEHRAVRTNQRFRALKKANPDMKNVHLKTVTTDAQRKRLKMNPENIHQVNKNKLDDGTFRYDVILDARKLKAGEMPHEIFHVVTENYWAKNPQAFEAFKEATKLYVEEAFAKRKIDLDGNPLKPGAKRVTFEQMIKDAYQSQAKGGNEVTYSKEWSANLVALLGNKKFSGLFIKENMFGALNRSFNRVRDKAFRDENGKIIKGYEKMAAKYDSAGGIIELLHRWAVTTGKGNYDAKLTNMLLGRFKDLKVEKIKGPDGKYKTEILNKEGDVVSETFGARNTEVYNRRNKLQNEVTEILENKPKHKDWKKKVVEKTQEIDRLTEKLDPDFEALGARDLEGFEREVQELYTDPTKWDKIQKAFEPRIKEKLKTFREGINPRSYQFEAIVERALGPERGVLEMIIKYKPETNKRFTLDNGREVDVRQKANKEVAIKERGKYTVVEGLEWGKNGETIREYIEKTFGKISSEKPTPLSGVVQTLINMRMQEYVIDAVPEWAPGVQRVSMSKAEYLPGDVAEIKIETRTEKDIDILPEDVGKFSFFLPKADAALILDAVAKNKDGKAVGIRTKDKMVTWDQVDYKTFTDVLPGITIDAFGGKGWSYKVKAGEKTSQAENKVLRFAENAETSYNINPKTNTIPTGKFAGKATGVYRLTKVDNVYYETRIVDGKKVRAESTLSKEEGGAGNVIQDKVRYENADGTFNKNKYLKTLGIEFNFDGILNTKVGVFEMKDGKLTNKAKMYQRRIDMMIEQLGTATSNQIVSRAIDAGAVAPNLKMGQTVQTLTNQITAGRAEILGARLVIDFQNKFPELNWKQSRDILSRYAWNPKLVDKKYSTFLNKFNSGGLFNSSRVKAMLSSVELDVLAKKVESTNFEKQSRVVELDLSLEVGKKEVGKEPTTLKDLGVEKVDIENIDISSAFRTDSKNGVIHVDVKKLNKIATEQLKFVEKLPAELGKHGNLGWLKGFIGMQIRTTGYGLGTHGSAVITVKNKKKENIKKKIQLRHVDAETGKDIDMNSTWINTTYEVARKNVGKNVDPVWKEKFGENLEGLLKGLKTGTTTAQAQRDIANAKTDAQKIEIALKHFNSLENQTKKDIHYALEVTKQNHLYESTSKKEFLDRSQLIYQMARFNSNQNYGTRQLAPITAVFFGKGKVSFEGVKLEHLKTSVLQSLQSANLIVEGRFKGMGENLINEFAGLMSITRHLKLIDKDGGNQNPAGLNRMALLGKEILQQHRTVESGFKETLYDHMMKNIAKDVKVTLTEMKEPYLADAFHDYIFNPSKATKAELDFVIKNKNSYKKVHNQNVKLSLKNEIYGARKLTTSQLVDKLNKRDKAIAEANKKIKERKGISVWDFDDTLAHTRSGVRYRMPNPSNKPASGRKVVFLAGAAGSGKSNVVRLLQLEKQGYKIINPDIALEFLKKQAELPNDMRDFTPAQKSLHGKIQWEARQISKGKRGQYIGQGKGVVIDGTGSSLKNMSKLKLEIENSGYDSQMMFVETSLKEALRRNKARKERSLSDEIIEATWKKVNANKEIFREMFGDRFAEVNTEKLKQTDPLPKDFIAKIEDFTNSYINGRLNAGEFANRSKDLMAKDAKFDFTEFNKIVDAKKGPLFDKALERNKKFGNEDVYVLTARPKEAQLPIFEYLKQYGLDIKLKNITALADGRPEAKANWMAEKASEGYNDFYFADDATGNIRAVRKVLDKLDVKSKLQQVEVLGARNLINKKFNEIIERTVGIKADVKISKARAKMLGKGKWTKSVIVPGAQDFMGLMQNFMGRGKKGDADIKFYEKHLVKPFAEAVENMNQAKQRVSEDYKALSKQLPKAKENLTKKLPNSPFTHSHAVRVYLWNKAGRKIPGLSKGDVKELVDAVKKDTNLLRFAEKLNAVAKNKYIEPGEGWLGQTILSDLHNLTMYEGRKNFLAKWIENKNILFSEANMNKIRASQGGAFVSALKDVLYRMETGSNRPTGRNKLANAHMNFLNGSVGATMFLNMRSALLQTISATNYINWAENNPAKAAAAFGNQKQYWKDFSMIWNSAMLKQRRKGLKYNVQEAELAAAVEGSSNKANVAISWLLKKGFTPTQIADSFAISTGGATYYRNRVDMYKKKGLSIKNAEKKAFIDFQEVTEKNQQSSRADLISQQQASVLGRTILAWANTPMQYARIQEKSARNIINGRGDFKSNLSKIVYYGAIQSIVFASLQSALFAFGLDKDEDLDDKDLKNRVWRIVNTMADSQLRGVGTPGALISAIKNTGLQFHAQEKKGWNADHTRTWIELMNYSPVLGSKVRKLYSATETWRFNKDVIPEMGLDLDNPINMAIANVVEATTNIPLARTVQKIDNLRETMDERNQWWQRVATFLGYSKWNVGAETEEVDIIKDKIKLEKKYPGKSLEEIKVIQQGKEVFKLKKDEQIIILRNLGLSDIEIKKLKYEQDRVDKILELKYDMTKQKEKSIDKDSYTIIYTGGKQDTVWLK